MADATRHVLVVVDRGAVSAALRVALLGRAAAGPAEFTLLLPAPEDGSADHPDQLLAAVEQLRAEGLDVAGQLGHPDPLLAVRQVWDPVEYDEIVVTTLPRGRSHWLAHDVPAELKRATGAEVVQVVLDR